MITSQKSNISMTSLYLNSWFVWTSLEEKNSPDHPGTSSASSLWPACAPAPVPSRTQLNCNQLVGCKAVLADVLFLSRILCAKYYIIHLQYACCLLINVLLCLHMFMFNTNSQPICAYITYTYYKLEREFSTIYTIYCNTYHVNMYVGTYYFTLYTCIYMLWILMYKKSHDSSDLNANQPVHLLSHFLVVFDGAVGDFCQGLSAQSLLFGFVRKVGHELQIAIKNMMNGWFQKEKVRSEIPTKQNKKHQKTKVKP